MAPESLQVALIKYNKKTWCKSLLLGVLLGVAVIVPGISGSTVAIIFKLYDAFIYALGNLFKRFKQCFAFLLPIGLGLVLGVVAGFFTVQKLLDFLPFAIIGLFAGLMVGAFPAVLDEWKGDKRTAKDFALTLLGVLVPLALGIVSVLLMGEGKTDVFAKVEWWHVALALPVGYVLGVTQIVPGLSASAVLMSIGWFSALLSSASLSYWRENPAIFLVYIALGVGLLLGVLTFSKVLSHLLAKARKDAFSVIIGLSLGSILTMFYNPDIFEKVYIPWHSGGVQALDLILGIALFAVGMIAAYLLVRVERKKKSEEPKGE